MSCIMNVSSSGCELLKKNNFFDRQQRKNMKTVGVLKLVSVHDPVQSLPNKVTKSF